MFYRILRYALSFLVSASAFAFAQEIPPSPPSHVIAAAQAAFPEYGGGTTFDAILKSGGTLPDPIVIPKSFDPAPGGSVLGAPTYPSPHIASLVGRSDFVALGTPLKRWTYPIVGNSSSVSIYLVHLRSVTIQGKENLVAGRDIYIARAGGPFVYEGHNFRAIDPNFQLFHLNEPYLFFGSQVIPGLYKVDSDRALKE